MAETRKPSQEFTLRLRRYDPESGEAPYWAEHTIKLEPHRSVLEAILQAKARFDGSIGVRCSCKAAICGSCGVRVNGQPGLACHTHLDEALRTSADGVIEVEPMGNMPVIKDLIVDMDAVHWKKIQRVTPWLINKQPIPEREYLVDREAMVDVTQTMACIQCGACVSDCLSMEVDPLFIGPAALAKAYRFVGDPRDDAAARATARPRRGSARPLRLHPLLQVHRGVPQGVAPMSQIMRLRAPRDRRPPHRRSQQRRAPRVGVRHARPPGRPPARGRAAAAVLRRRLVVRQVRAQGGRRAHRLAPGHHAGAAAPQGHAEGRARTAQLPKDALQEVRSIFDKVDGTGGALRAQPLHLGYDEDSDGAKKPDVSAVAGGGEDGAMASAPGPNPEGRTKE